MASSILAIWNGSDDSSSLPDYNGHKIKLDGNYYVIKTDYGDVYGYTYPSYLETIEFVKSLSNAINPAGEIIILFDPDDEYINYIELFRSELAQRDLYNLGKTASFAITKENDEYSFPVLDCESAPVATIYLRTINLTTSHIYQEGNCIILEGESGLNLARVKDRFVYTLYKVME